MTINATAIWRVRPSGSNTNGGGYDPGISGAATDYSQQNAAQASGTNLSGTTSTVTDSTAAAFTSVMIGNAMYVTGGGSTTGWYFVISRTNANTVVLDRSPGSTVSGATWALGGGWADFWTNPTTTGPVVPGNIIYILGGGTPNPSSYSYDYSASIFTCVAGNDTAGFITFANDPSTPGYKAPPDTTGGMPCIQLWSVGSVVWNSTSYVKLSGLYLVAQSAALSGTLGPINASHFEVFGCVLDQFSFDTGISSQGAAWGTFMGNEIFSSVSPGSHGTNPAIEAPFNGAIIIDNNIHDTVGPGISSYDGANASYLLVAERNIVAKCRGVGIFLEMAPGTASCYVLVQNNTVDANIGNGIEIADQLTLSQSVIVNNIITNHITASTYGITVDAGSTAANNAVKNFVDYNTFYNNTIDLNAISYGPHDTHGGSNPYVNQSTENYTLS